MLLFACLSAWASPTLDWLAEQIEPVKQELMDREQPVHYTALTVLDVHRVDLATRSGALFSRRDDVERYAEVDLRVGTALLDSTHPLRGFSSLAPDTRMPLRLPDDLGYAAAHRVRREIDARYREAAENLVVLKANQNVLVEEETPAPDFEPRKRVKDIVEVPELSIDLDAWEPLLLEASSLADQPSFVHENQVRLTGVREVKHLVDTEGSRLQHGRVQARLSVQLTTTVDDGDQLQVFDAIDVHDASTLPTDLEPWIRTQIERLRVLREAPRGEPTSGPVLLSGRAAGVFLHEVIGHRVEGHRQKREDEGKTFAEKIGELILPPGIDIVDDPTLQTLGDTDLNGHYDYDDEGVRAEPAVLVKDGRFQGFLMGRSPLPGQPHSNGHGRRSTGRAPLARMGNTVLRAENTVPIQELRSRLLKEAKESGQPYGTIIEDIEGGFALTGRQMPNAFNIRAVASRRVYVDGRPDEWVRGIDLVGTPFQAFSNLIAVGDDAEVFNGTCGAESGWVPVSASSPSLLFRRLEFQLKEKAQQRPPLLEKPGGPTSTEVN